jgi:hypothetical protein
MAANERPARLGFPVKVLARPELKSNDSRRWQGGPHLKTSLEYLDAILDHLARHRIGMYRMSSDLAPYATHPDMPQFHGMVEQRRRARDDRRQGEGARHPAVVPPLAVRADQQPRPGADG